MSMNPNVTLSPDDLKDSNGAFETTYMKREAYEHVAPDIAKKEHKNQYMRIENLMKEYDNGFRAVKGINLKLYAD